MSLNDVAYDRVVVLPLAPIVFDKFQGQESQRKPDAAAEHGQAGSAPLGSEPGPDSPEGGRRDQRRLGCAGRRFHFYLA